MKIKYDLHIHSCLSPCCDDDMTPAVIAGIAKLNGLDLIALTDHNSTANCGAFMRVAKFYGIAALCGLELTTSEEIHVLCLFDFLDNAEKFSKYVESHHTKIKNKPNIFGRQLIVDEFDQICGEIDNLLITATDIGFNEVDTLVSQFGGVAVPAHIDKASDSMVGVLGALPDEAKFTAFELFRNGSAISNESERKKLIPRDSKFIVNSDAHSIADIGIASGEIECGDLSMIDFLKGVAFSAKTKTKTH